MCKKYKMMGLAAAACVLLGVNTSEAAVTMTISQLNASTVIGVWSGTYVVPTPSSNGDSSIDQIGASTSQFFGRAAGQWEFAGPGTVNVSGIPSLTGTYVGDAFGYGGGSSLVFPRDAVGTISPSGTFTFSGTLAGLGIPNLNNFLAYTGSNNVGNSSQIFLNVVPEPSSALLGGLGLLALFRRRR